MNFRLRFFCCLAFVGLSGAFSALAGGFLPGDLVRLSRSETLQFKGEKFLTAPKGQEFNILKHDLRQNIAYVGFYKEDGTLIAVSVPASALESAPMSLWEQVRSGVDAFRDGRYDEARRLLTIPGRGGEMRSVVNALAPRITGAVSAASVARVADAAHAATARQALTVTLQGLRDASAQLMELGLPSLAIPLEEGADRLGGSVFGPVAGGVFPPGIPPSKIDRADAAKRDADATRCAFRCRQAMALRRMYEANKDLKEGLDAEPGHLQLKEYQVKVQKDLADADENYENANRMRRFPDGTPHALTAMEHGLKSCADHPGLLALRREMESAFEERTAPPVTASLFAAAKVRGGSQKAAEEGRKLYTERCTECHDLELLDSRSLPNWEKAVGSMSGRAHLTDEQKGRIMEYLTVAWNGMSAN